MPLINTLPTEWDETQALPDSRFDELAAYAWRKGKDWYFGIINGFAKEPQEYQLNLSFHGDGDYKAFLCIDIHDSKKIQVEEKVVSQSDVLKVKMNPTGGFLARFQPVSP